MGLAEYFLGSGNPFAQWANSNRRTLGGIGAGLASGTNFGEGLSLAARGAAAGREADDAYATQQKAEAQRVAEINQTAEWLKANYPQFADLPPAQGFQLAAQLAGQKQGGSEYSERYSAGQQFGLQGEDLNTFALTGSVPGTARTNVTYGTTPVWGKDSTTGKTGYGVTGSDGSFKLVDTGGFQPMGPGEVAADRAGGALTGKTEVQAAIDLPAAVQKGEYAIKQLKGLLSVAPNEQGVMVPNQGFEEQFGTLGPIPIGQMTGAIPNTPKAGFQARLNQVQGQAFLQAFESLKGGGAISEVEGLKAEQAIMRASVSQTKEDFEAAIKEAIGIYELGIQRAKDLVTQGVGGRAQQVLGGTGGNVTSGGISWSVEP